jgi:hypothetical protein
VLCAQTSQILGQLESGRCRLRAVVLASLEWWVYLCNSVFFFFLFLSSNKNPAKSFAAFLKKNSRTVIMPPIFYCKGY